MSLHQRQIALKSIESEDWSGKNILDIGCSNGKLSHEIMQKTNAKKLTGIDPDSERIAKANNLVVGKLSKNMTFCVAMAEDLSLFTDNMFDIVFCNMAFQQFDDKQKSLIEIHRVLKKGAIAVINFNIEKSPVWYQQELIYNNLSGNPNKTISREKTFKADQFKPMTEKAGFKNIEIKIEDNLYYYGGFEDLIDKMDISYFAKIKNLTVEQNEQLNIELKRYLESIRTQKGIPESWKILFARLVK